MFDNTYKTISAKAEGLFKDKGSRFIGLAFPVKSEAEVKEILADIKKKRFEIKKMAFFYIVNYPLSIFN